MLLLTSSVQLNPTNDFAEKLCPPLVLLSTSRSLQRSSFLIGFIAKFTEQSLGFLFGFLPLHFGLARDLLIEDECSVRNILGRHPAVVHRKRVYRYRGVTRLRGMAREVRGLRGGTGDGQRGSTREHDHIFPHGILLSGVQDANSSADQPL
jgi:hypothetical protein